MRSDAIRWRISAAIKDAAIIIMLVLCFRDIIVSIV